MAEYEINLENLVKMKRVFEEADEDGSGELDPDEFYEKLGPYLGEGLRPAAVSQLFMRIDADCGGTIDWQEFIDYMFLQRASSSTSDSGGMSDWRLHAEDHWRKEWRGAGHKEVVERVYCCEPLGQYITGGRGGALRVWNADSLAPVQTLTNGTGWVTDCTYLECPAFKKLVVAGQDRTLTFYDPVRSTFEYSSRLTCPGSMGPPLCLAELQRDAGTSASSRLVWGDTEGSVMLLKSDPPPLHTERQMTAKRDYEVLHSGHADWVTHLQHIPDVGLVSSSLDTTLRMLDLERGVLAATVGVHKKGVRTFAYSPAFSLVASGGVERSVLLWQPKGNVNKPVGELPGHTSGVCQLVVADAQSQVITLSDDHVVRVWDLRNHKCVQAIGKADWLRPEDSKPTAMGYDTSRRRMVCASYKPVSWSHRQVEAERQHDARLVGALYNQTFSVVVSGDEGGTICMWNTQTGRREGGFSLHSKPSAATGPGASKPAKAAKDSGCALAPTAAPKLTAMAFDSNQRRLLTALDKGVVRVYNFNSGAVLSEFVSREARQELTAVAFVPHQPAAAEEAEAPAGAAGGAEQQGQAGGGAEGGERARAGSDHHSGMDAAASFACWQPAASGDGNMSEHELMMRQREDQQAAARQSQQHQQGPALEQGSPPAARQEDSSSAAGDSCDANLVLATGWGRSLCVWEEGEEARSSRCRRLLGHDADVLCMALLGRDVVATGDFAGAVRVWHVPTGTCLATCNFGGPEFERAVRRLCWLPAGSGAASCATPRLRTPGTPRTGSSTPQAGTPRTGPNNPRSAVSGTADPSPLLLVAGDNGGLQFWQVPVRAALSAATSAAAAEEALPPPAACRLVCSVTATHRRQDCLTALCLEEDGGGDATNSSSQAGQCRLWTGDSSGHVALWDLSALVAYSRSLSQGPACAANGAAAAVPTLAVAPPPRRLVHWRAAGASVVSLELMQAAGRGMLLVAGQDAAIGIWTRQGGLAGVFGKHSWVLEDPATWQDANAAAVPAPLSAEDEGSGLTPREIIANTPRRSNWMAARGGSERPRSAGPPTERQQGGGGWDVRSGSQTARQLGGASGSQTARQLGGSSGALTARRLPASSAPPTSRTAAAEEEARQGDMLSRLHQMCLPGAAGSGSLGGQRSHTAAVVTALEPVADLHRGTSPVAATAAHPAGEAAKAGSGVRQFLSPSSAGARLGALAAESAASKAERWTLPVHVQAHSMLSLQRMDDVPHDTANMWAQVKACSSAADRERQAGRGGSPAGACRSLAPPSNSIGAIMGTATAFGRRATPVHLPQMPPAQQRQ